MCQCLADLQKQNTVTAGTVWIQTSCCSRFLAWSRQKWSVKLIHTVNNFLSDKPQTNKLWSWPSRIANLTHEARADLVSSHYRSQSNNIKWQILLLLFIIKIVHNATMVQHIDCRLQPVKNSDQKPLQTHTPDILIYVVMVSGM